MNYFEALQLVKSSFLDGSEKNIVIRHIADHFKPGCLRLLDVGIGDGRYVGKIVSELRRADLTCSVLGVDPLPAANRAVNKLFPEFQVEAQRFEDFSTSEQYDIVIATHSLYYVHDADECLKKMVALTKAGGLTIVVLWSEQCALFRIYRQYKERCRINGGNGFVTAEKALATLSSLTVGHHPGIEYFNGRILLSHWKSLPGMLESACMIFSRDAGLQKDHKIHKEHTESLRRILGQFQEVEARVNGVIIVKK